MRRNSDSQYDALFFGMRLSSPVWMFILHEHQPLLPVVTGSRDDNPLDRALALDGVILPHAPIALAIARRLVPWWRALQRNAPANTVRALWADARHYIRWCGLNGRVAVPARPETVIAYLTALSKNGAATGSRPPTERWQGGSPPSQLFMRLPACRTLARTGWCGWR